MEQYVEALLAKAKELPPSADVTRLVEAVTPMGRRSQQQQQQQPKKESPPTEAAVGSSETAAAVAAQTAALADRVDALRESVAQEAMRAARLEASLSSGQGSAADEGLGAAGRSELLATLGAIELGLRDGQRERDALLARVVECEAVAGRVLAEIRTTQTALASSNWLLAGLAVTVPLLVLSASALARRFGK